ncbi:MAG: ABC transporter permease [Acidimicrobiia bacterium]|nr:ABC transporter permease [Acidimicrobiia bacterium]
MLATIFTKAIRDRSVGVVMSALAVALLGAGAVWIYRDVGDLIAELVAGMPETIVSAVGLSGAGTGTTFVLGEMLNLIAPMVLGGIAISIGTSAIAGEERDGTLGLLLANPRSRTSVLLSKTGALLAMSVVGSLFLWGAVVVAVGLVGGEIGNLTLGAMAVHLMAFTMFMGGLALFIGSWTGNAAVASGVSVGVLIFSFLAAGLLPLVNGLENLAKIFPWYYFNSSKPIESGIDGLDLSVLVGATAILIGGALIGVNRRDLRAGAGGTLVERLFKNHPRVAGYVERMAGKPMVANIPIKTVTDHQFAATISAAAIFYTAVLVGPMFNGLSSTLGELTSALPEALLRIVGGVDMSTPAGWYHAEVFSLVIPAAIGALTIMMGSRALAGEEDATTMDLLLANPITRSKVVVSKFVALVAMAALLGFATFVGSVGGVLLGGLDLSIANIAAASFQGVGLAVLLGASALLGGAVTGRPKAAAYSGIAVGLVGFVMYSFLPVNENLAGWAKLSPFYYYADNSPLENGISWGYMGILFGVSLLLVLLASVAFERRDIRN